MLKFYVVFAAAFVASAIYGAALHPELSIHGIKGVGMVMLLGAAAALDDG